MTQHCRAKNPATCRTHGERIRTEMHDATQVFSNNGLDSYTVDRAVDQLNRLKRFSPDTMALITPTIQSAFDKHGHFGTVDAYQIGGAISQQLTAAKGDLAKHKFDFSTYPGDSLAARDKTAASSKGWYDRQVWFRDNGVTEDSPDTVFGATYVYCASHRRAHAAGWCTVSIVNKAPLTASNQAEATDEARAKNFRIFGDPEPAPEPVTGPAPLYGVRTDRAIDNNRWAKTLPAADNEELKRLIRKAKKKDVLLTIENYRNAYETNEAAAS